MLTGNTLLQRTTPSESLARVFALVEALMDIGLAIGSLAVPILVSSAGARPGARCRCDPPGGGAPAAAPDPPLRPGRTIRGGRCALRAASVTMRIFAAAPAPVRATHRRRRRGDRSGLRPRTSSTRARPAIASTRSPMARWRSSARARPSPSLGRGDGIGARSHCSGTCREPPTRSRAPTRLFALDRTAFVVALTGHEPARREADRIIDEYDP